MEGTRLGRWVLRERIGEGATSSTWLAVDAHAPEAGSAPVVVKILRPERALASPWLVERLHEEARVADGSAPGLARSIAAGASVVDEGTLHHVVFEHAGAQSLQEIVARGLPDEAFVRAAGARLAEGLAHLHARGLVHGDVKPANVRVGERGACLVDLGLAQPAGEPHSWLQPGETAGTPAYMAPEQWDGAAPGFEADVYALGVTLYELATGQHPFLADTSSATAARHLSRQPLAAWAIRPELSPEIAELLRDMIAKDPADRPTAALAARILRGDGALAWRSPEQARRAAVHAALSALGGRREIPLVGRDSELGALLEAREAARAAGDPRVVLLWGPGGHGKSRLAFEVVTRVAAANPEAEILFGQARDAGGDPLSDALARRFERAELESLLVSRTSVDAALAARAASSVHGQAPGEGGLGGAELTPLLAALVASLARTREVVLVLDDLHHAGAPSWRALAQLAAGTDGARLFVLGLSRTEAPAAQAEVLATRRGFSSVPVGELSAAAVAGIVSAALAGSGLPARLTEAVVARAGGSPLLALRFASAVRSGGAGVAELGGTLLDAAATGLAKEDRALLGALAIAGDGSPPALLAAMTGATAAQVVRRLAAIEWGPGLVASVASGYRFEHQLLRDAFAGGIDEATRRDLHRRAASALGSAPAAGPQALAIALHWIEAGEPAGAVSVARDAVRAAMARYAWDVASRIVRACVPLVEEADPALGARLCLDEATALRHAGLSEEREAPLRQARDLARRAGLERERMLAELELAAAPAGYSPAEVVRGPLEALQDDIRAVGDADLLMEMCRMLGLVRFRCGDRDGAEALWREGLAVARATGVQDERPGGFLGNLGVAAAVAGRIDEARERYRAQLEEVRRTGHAVWEARALLNLASACHREGRLVEAIDASRQALEAAIRRGDPTVEIIAHFNLGLYELEMGRISAALAVADEIERSTAGTAKLRRHQALRIRATAVAAEGRFEEALAMVEDTIGTLADTGQEDTATALDLTAANLLIECGRLDDARARVEDVLSRPGLDRDALVVGRAMLARLGGLGAEDAEPPDDAEPRIRVEAWLHLHATTGRREAVREAERIVSEMAARLPEEAREDYWRNWEFARRVRKALAESASA